MGHSGSWSRPKTSLTDDTKPASPVPGLDLLLPPASNSQTLLSLQYPAQTCSHSSTRLPSFLLSPLLSPAWYSLAATHWDIHPCKAFALQFLQLCRATVTHGPQSRCWSLDLHIHTCTQDQQLLIQKNRVWWEDQTDCSHWAQGTMTQAYWPATSLFISFIPFSLSFSTHFRPQTTTIPPFSRLWSFP